MKLLEKMHSGSFGVYVPTPESEVNRKRLKELARQKQDQIHKEIESAPLPVGMAVESEKTTKS